MLNSNNHPHGNGGVKSKKNMAVDSRELFHKRQRQKRKHRREGKALFYVLCLMAAALVAAVAAVVLGII